jgi:hypothetical protein
MLGIDRNLPGFQTYSIEFKRVWAGVRWSPKGGTPIKGDTPMDNRTARNKEVSDRAKKLEAQIMGHMFDMCWPEFIAYCHEVGWRADRIDAGEAKAKVKARVVEPFR